MNLSTRGQHKCPFILGNWQMNTGTCVMSSPSSQLTHTLVYMHGSALSDTLTHRAPEASINLALRVQNNLLIISHSNSLQSPLDNCLNTHPAADCNQTVMRYCFYFPGHGCVCIFRHGNACVYLFMQYALL